jgi:putative oxidoreductase
MTDKKTDVGSLVSRVALGVVLLAHSAYLKAVVFTLPGTADYFSSLGLPGISAYAVFLIEVVAGIALVVGYRVRTFSVAVIPVLLGATWAHMPNGWLFTNEGGGWEYPLVLSAMALAQAFSGAGAFRFRTKHAEEPLRVRSVPT